MALGECDGNETQIGGGQGRGWRLRSQKEAGPQERRSRRELARDLAKEKTVRTMDVKISLWEGQAGPTSQLCDLCSPRGSA